MVMLNPAFASETRFQTTAVVNSPTTVRDFCFTGGWSVAVAWVRPFVLITVPFLSRPRARVVVIDGVPLAMVAIPDSQGWNGSTQTYTSASVHFSNCAGGTDQRSASDERARNMPRGLRPSLCGRRISPDSSAVGVHSIRAARKLDPDTPGSSIRARRRWAASSCPVSLPGGSIAAGRAHGS